MEQLIQLSNYEIMVPLDDARTLLANGLYCAFDVVDRAEGSALAEGRFDAVPDEECRSTSRKPALTL